jgi:hypothetical protein
MRAVFLVAFALVASQILAQDGGRAGRAGRASRANQADASQQQLLESQAQAAASAARPGDENLSCEALQTELFAITQSPEMQAFTQQMGARAQTDLDKLRQVQEQQTAVPKPGIARALVQGVVTSAIPGLGRAAAQAQEAQQAAQAAQMQVEAERNIQSMAAQTSQISAMMGPMMRGQHVMELAQARGCAWLQQPGAAPSAASPIQGIPIPQPIPPPPQ